METVSDNNSEMKITKNESDRLKNHMPGLLITEGLGGTDNEPQTHCFENSVPDSPKTNFDRFTGKLE